MNTEEYSWLQSLYLYSAEGKRTLVRRLLAQKIQALIAQENYNEIDILLGIVEPDKMGHIASAILLGTTIPIRNQLANFNAFFQKYQSLKRN